MAYKNVPNPEDELECSDRPSWRAWLSVNHETCDSIWLIFHKKNSPTTSIDYESAVLEALCFGWIDSKVQRIDDHRYRQYFSKRKPTGNWNAVNKARVAQLRSEGLMTDAGEAAIATAKENGAWEFLVDVEAMVVPDDLSAALSVHANARENFDAFSNTKKQGVLFWIKQAKRAATRADRIAKTARAAANNETPMNYL
ncbi:MAG: YdeI/OmpD-associated family protein [Acidimicrobiales bacterium]